MPGSWRATSAITFPASRSIVPRNMPGAGSRAAASWVYNVAPKDGTVLATADQSLSLQQAIGDKRIRFDTSKFIYIGNPNAENNTTAAWHAPASRRSRTPSARCRGRDRRLNLVAISKAMNALPGTKFKIIPAIPAATTSTSPWSAARWRSAAPTPGRPGRRRADWLREHKINILVQIGLKKAPDLPDVPLMMDLAKNDEDPALSCCRRRRGRPAALHHARCSRGSRQGVAQGVRRHGEGQGLPRRGRPREKFDIEPTTGEAMQKIVTEMMAVPKAQRERLKQIIE